MSESHAERVKEMAVAYVESFDTVIGPGNPVEHDLDQLARAYLDLLTEQDALREALMTSWGLLCNVSEGDWEKQSEEWQEAVLRYRDTEFHPLLAALPTPKQQEDER